jgi:hypothetical protein
MIILAWLLSRELVIAIARSKSLKHIKENAEATKLTLDVSEIEVLDDLFKSPTVLIDTTIIEIPQVADRNVYKNIDEAKKNTNNMVPSPSALAEQFLQGLKPKPIKLRARVDGKYDLIEGRLKYWGWVIAFGASVPIPALNES